MDYRHGRNSSWAPRLLLYVAIAGMTYYALAKLFDWPLHE